MLRKTWLLGIVILFIGASVIPSINAEIKTKDIVPIMADWSDNFDSYEDGQYLDGDPEDGGWHGWAGDPLAGAYVVNDEFLSEPHSVELVDSEDLVHEFEGIDSGLWTFTCYVFIPSEIIGSPFFIMLNTYSDAGPNHWSTEVEFNTVTDMVESYNDEASLPLIYDEWVEIRNDIDLDADMQAFHYGGDLLIEKSWSAGASGPGGLTEIQCVDLWSASATMHYYDDFSLVGEQVTGPDLDCEGSLSWTEVTPGETVAGTFTVENVGEAASELNWEIESTPDWGTFTFDPDGGTGLTPEAGALTVDVEVVAPDDPETEFAGEIVLVNSDDPEDTCVIDVALVTPMSYNMPFLQWFMDRHPIIKEFLGF